MYVIPALHPAFLLRMNRRLAGTVHHAIGKAHKLAYGKGIPRWVEDEFILPPDGTHGAGARKKFLPKVLTALKAFAGRKVTYDVETDGRHPLNCDLRCLGLYSAETVVNGKKLPALGITIPFLYRTGEREQKLVKDKKGEVSEENRAVWARWWTPEDEAQVVAALQELLGSSGFLQARQRRTQNGQYDRMVLKSQLGVEVPAGDAVWPVNTPYAGELFSFDSIIAHHVIAPYLPHDLGLLSALYTNAPFYKATDKGDAWSSESDAELFLYCVRDCKTTDIACDKLEREVDLVYASARAIYTHDMWQERQCEEWKRAGFSVDRPTLEYFRWHYRGVRDRALAKMREIVKEVLQGKRASVDSEDPLEQLLGKLSEKADEEEVDETGRVVEYFNPASLRQLRALLVGVGIPLREVTATGDLSTAKELLTAARKEMLEQGVQPFDVRIAFLDYLFAWRESGKIEGTYLYPEILADGRVHPTFNVHVVPTGRLSSSGPNFQNLPAEIRGMFVAWLGHVVVSMDWDAGEMRLGAFMSGDPEYIEVFRQYDAKTGPKPHIANMSVIFGLPATKEAAEQNPAMYRAAKVFAYAVAYGAGEDTVFAQVREEMPDMDHAAFKLAFGNYKKRYKALFEYQAKGVQQGSKQGWLESPVMHRRMFFFESAFDGNSPEATVMQNCRYQSGLADVVGQANKRIENRVVPKWKAKLLQPGELLAKPKKSDRPELKEARKWYFDKDIQTKNFIHQHGEVLQQLAQVHDELVYELPERLADGFMAEMKAVAEEKPVDADGKVLDWNMPVDAHWSRRWKPVQARCGTKKVVKDAKGQNVITCRELVDLEPAEGRTTIWEGECKCGAKKVIDISEKGAA